MDLGRRGFLSVLMAAAVAPDPERLLWTPGKKLISIPGWNTTTSTFEAGDRLVIAWSRPASLTSITQEYTINVKWID